jgi:hypothetical protein
MQKINKLGEFYLGKIVSPTTGSVTEEVLTYPSKDLNTHAVCVGMTGSGKTGLGIVMLEEAALDGIPAIIIDPKGDLGNLLLAFPNLSPEEFLPWIDQEEASKKGLSAEQYAAFLSKMWKEGLSNWGEDKKRIEAYKNAVESTLYTPASRAGLPLSILNSFKAPSQEILLDTAGAFRDRLLSTTTSLLGLIGIKGDPIQSKEHILISTILEQAWKNNQDLDLPTLIQQIQKPPFDRVGVFSLDTFYPTKDRLTLSKAINNLIASPGFSNWMEGESLDIQALLYTKEGKPRQSIISIAHLSDPERMFFVTLFLNELLSWVRRQSGTSSLRAIFYMDEIFGFFPPIANPPSKTPMLSLLKQARAFGLGIILATQNPVDLDYKGLANCGTWFIGKLQTDRDKSRVLEGLQTASNTDLGLKEMQKMLAYCGNRIFVMRSVHEDKPILFQTRWTLCYLRGPLTLPQIKSLTKNEYRVETPSSTLSTAGLSWAGETEKPVTPLDIPEYTLKSKATSPDTTYRPLALGIAKLHFVDAKNKIDTWVERVFTAPFSDDEMRPEWENGELLTEGKKELAKVLPSQGKFESLPAGLLDIKNYQTFTKSFISFLYQTQTLDLFEAPDLKLFSKENETERDFQARLNRVLHETRDQAAEQIKSSYAKKIQSLKDKVRKANDKVEKLQNRAGQQRFSTLISIGKAILGGIFGRKVASSGTISNAGTAIQKAGRLGKDAQDIAAAEEDLKVYQQQLIDLAEELQNELAHLTDVTQVKIEKSSLKPRKTDILPEQIAILWWPIGSQS